MTKVMTRVALPLFLVTIGVVVAMVVFRLAPSAAQAQPTPQPTLVEVMEAVPRDATSQVTATGTVTPARQITVTPQVTGRIVDRSPSLEPGGRLTAGEEMIRVDPRDYQLALERERARVTTAELELQTERGRGRVARVEMDLVAGGRPLTGEEEALALRRPHLRAAKANLDAARSGVRRARLDLSRTVLRAPWNAVVLEAQAEEGQVVGPSTRIATLVGTDQMWVRVSVPERRAVELDIPDINSSSGSRARVHQTLDNGRSFVWEGEVLRLEGQLEPETRTAQLLIVVEAPFESPEGGLPLLPGAFVRVELEGRQQEGVYQIPREALHDGNRLWVVDEGQRLASRRVEVLWGTSSAVYVRGEIESGDRVVTSPLTAPLAGEQVRIETAEGAVERAERFAPHSDRG